jgi:hypothetical protein
VHLTIPFEETTFAMQRPLIPCLILVLSSLSFAQDFDGKKAFDHISALAAPEMQGRQSGLNGGRIAEEYVADHFLKLGLAYIDQSFPMLVSTLEGASMEITKHPFGPIPLTLHEDFYPLTHSGSGMVEAQVVFVGYGISKPDKGWDDYAGMDVSGKIVLIYRGTPPVPDQDWSEESSRNYTVNEAHRRGAAAVLYLQRPYPIHGAAIQEEAYHENLPMAYIAEHIVHKLCMNTGLDLEAYKEAPAPLATPHVMKIDFQVKRIPDGKARNVSTIVEGTDPVLKNEFIVIGGHMDHLGPCPNGLVFAGANDNASGTSMVLELARVFSEKPAARSLLFTAFAAEEQGLLGSKYMVENLLVKRDGVAMMVNFEMTGHGTDGVGIGGGEMFPQVWRAFLESADPSVKEKIQASRSWGGGSDQGPFIDAGIPAFTVWSRGDHHFYHSVEDTIDWIKPEALENVGRAAEGMIRTFADWPEPLADGYAAERFLWARGCHVDFLGTIEEPAAPGFVQGRIWSLPDKDLFELLPELEEIEAPCSTGKSFGDVRGNRSGHGFTYLPCLSRKAFDRLGEKAAPYLDKLGIAFIIDGNAIRRPQGDEEIRINDPSTEASLHVIRVKKGDDPKAIIEKLGVNRCHLDLTDLVTDNGREIFAFIRSLDFDEASKKKLLGGNLLKWPENE